MGHVAHIFLHVFCVIEEVLAGHAYLQVDWDVVYSFLCLCAGHLPKLVLLQLSSVIALREGSTAHFILCCGPPKAKSGASQQVVPALPFTRHLCVLICVFVCVCPYMCVCVSFYMKLQ